MNTKIITVLERHVEKIVLAVAVAGAGVIAWYGHPADDACRTIRP